MSKWEKVNPDDIKVGDFEDHWYVQSKGRVGIAEWPSDKEGN